MGLCFAGWILHEPDASQVVNARPGSVQRTFSSIMQQSRGAVRGSSVLCHACNPVFRPHQQLLQGREINLKRQNEGVGPEEHCSVQMGAVCGGGAWQRVVCDGVCRSHDEDLGPGHRAAEADPHRPHRAGKACHWGRLGFRIWGLGGRCKSCFRLVESRPAAVASQEVGVEGCMPLNAGLMIKPRPLTGQRLHQGMAFSACQLRRVIAASIRCRALLCLTMSSFLARGLHQS